MAGLDIDRDPNYVDRDRKEFKVVGKPNLPGKLSWAVATGVAKFGVDYVAPNMLEAKFMRSPYAHAKIKSYNKEKAMAIPGVVDIIAYDDPYIQNIQVSGGMSGPRHPFVTNEAHEENGIIGFIAVAENADICDEAFRQLDIEWEILPHSVDIKESRKPDATVLRPDDRGGTRSMFGGSSGGAKKGNVSTTPSIQGDVEKGFQEADHIIEFDLTLPPYASASPNPHGSVAWWFDDPFKGTDCLHIEGAVWHTSGGRNAIAQLYGVPTSKTVQHHLFQGGKYCDWTIRFSQQVTPLLAKKYGRPVRCVNERKDTFDFMVCQRFIHLKVGYKDDGTITAFDDFSIADGGTPDMAFFGTTGDQGYGPYIGTKCRNIKQVMDVVDSNRGFMAFSSQFCPFNWDAVTTTFHIIAEKLGKDVIDIARINLHGPDGQQDTRPVPSFDACIAAGKKMMNWNYHKNGAKTLADGRKHGASFRFQMCPRHAMGSDFHANLELRDGVVHMPIQGPHAGVFSVECDAMIACEELGIKYEDISIDYDPDARFVSISGGSDGLASTGWTMRRCARKLKKVILEYVIAQADQPAGARRGGMMGGGARGGGMMGGMMGGRGFGRGGGMQSVDFKGKKPEDLDIVDGVIVLKSDPSAGGTPVRSITENLFAAFSGHAPSPLWPSRYDLINTLYCEVAVDEETGEVEILKYGAAVDAGKVIRPTSLESQLDQVAFFSQGCQMFEDYFYDEKTGVKLNMNYIEYKKPAILDVPKLIVELPETRAGNGVYGACGISHSMANTHLIICAIYNAIGKWVDPPATPDKVLKVLGKA